MDETEKCKVYRSFHLKKAKEYEQILKELGAVKERKPKLKVPEIKWSFLKDEKKVDKTIYQRLGKSDIWVKKRKLQELQEKAKDMDEYARKLMWNILVPSEDVLALADKKVKGIGFVKMFGKKNFENLLGKP
ncbi:hypothetical protein RvY_06495 [Ramazzottius varieornatus]|uniref:Uncharacterized protein n=1 Tax=Ramazzottius varieornatus TaxID=947166 RepID=A0A1D1V8D6_RAMVA|nr:hypothetical protein RvY_06495 [Ramazzottius varieornatus]